MLLTPLIIALVYAAVPTLGQLDAATAKSTLPGTWSSGSQAVVTGAVSDIGQLQIEREALTA
jgi:hypothetical protein